MATELAHGWGALYIEGLGKVAELEDVSGEFTGDGTDLEALEGTVGTLPPKAKGINVSGNAFVPNTAGAYSEIVRKWDNGDLCYAVLRFGGMKIVTYGRFNAPSFTESGTKFAFSFRGRTPRITYP
jgi:hypothetical protein